MSNVLDWKRGKDGRGWLCVRSEDRSFAEPETLRRWYPIAPMTEHEAKTNHDIGLELDEHHNGCFAGADVYRRPYRLTHDGQTTPLVFEAIPIPPPKTRVETRWRDGRWQKLMARRGWVNA